MCVSGGGRGAALWGEGVWGWGAAPRLGRGAEPSDCLLCLPVLKDASALHEGPGSHSPPRVPPITVTVTITIAIAGGPEAAPAGGLQAEHILWWEMRGRWRCRGCRRVLGEVPVRRAHPRLHRHRRLGPQVDGSAVAAQQQVQAQGAGAAPWVGEVGSGGRVGGCGVGWRDPGRSWGPWGAVGCDGG